MRPAGHRAKAKETGGFRPAHAGRNMRMPAVEAVGRRHQSAIALVSVPMPSMVSAITSPGLSVRGGCMA